MFGSEVAATVALEQLEADATITGVVGQRIRNIDILPVGDDPPALLHHPTGGGNYGGPIAGESGEQTLPYAVRLICDGTSTDPILAAAKRQKVLLDGQAFNTTYDGDPYTVSFTATGETVPTTVYEGGKYYRLLGTSYEVHVTRG